MKAARPKMNGNQNARVHGLYSMKKALMRLGGHAIDRRYRVGKSLAKWRADLIADLGGDVTTQQSALIDLAVKQSCFWTPLTPGCLSNRHW
jgi:hypothetical protein